MDESSLIALILIGFIIICIAYLCASGSKWCKSLTFGLVDENSDSDDEGSDACDEGEVKVGSECKALGTECSKGNNFKAEYTADGCVEKSPPECVTGYVKVGSECKALGTECANPQGSNFKAEYTADGCVEKSPLECIAGYVAVGSDCFRADDDCGEGEVKVEHAVGSECKTIGTECDNGNNFKAEYTADGCVETAECVAGYVKVGSECKEVGTECDNGNNFKAEYTADGCVDTPDCYPDYVKVGSECKKLGNECANNNFKGKYTTGGCAVEIPLECVAGYVKVGSVSSECKEIGTECDNGNNNNFKAEYTEHGCAEKNPPECATGHTKVGNACQSSQGCATGYVRNSSGGGPCLQIITGMNGDTWRNCRNSDDCEGSDYCGPYYDSNLNRMYNKCLPLPPLGCTNHDSLYNQCQQSRPAGCTIMSPADFTDRCWTKNPQSAPETGTNITQKIYNLFNYACDGDTGTCRMIWSNGHNFDSYNPNPDSCPEYADVDKEAMAQAACCFGVDVNDNSGTFCR